MRASILTCALAVFAGACSGRDVRLRGTLAEGWTGAPLFVSLGDGTEPLEIRDGAFTLSGIPAGPVELRIGTGEDDDARMRIGDLPAGAALSLERIRVDREHDLAFPSLVRIRGAERVTINGIRVADPDALPARMDEAGVVLALGEDEGALLVRPRSSDLPDLPVVVGPQTRVTDFSGRAASLGDASAGDSVRVVGRTGSGYLHAERITLRRAPAEPSGAPDREAPAAESRPSRRERASEGAGGGDEKEREGRRGSQRANPRVPQGHRPPPGECRDWDPDLPPGQQPPPRKC